MVVVVVMLRSAIGRGYGRDSDDINDADDDDDDDDDDDEECGRRSVWNAGWLLTRMDQEFACFFMVKIYGAISRISVPQRRMRFAFLIELAA